MLNKMERLKVLLSKDWLWKVIVAVCVLLALIPMILCVFGNPLTCDETYYLSVMERMAEGKRLYHDVNAGYTPLWFCLMAVWKLLFHIPSGYAEAYYVFHFIMQVLAAFFLYKIICGMQINRKIAFFSSWLFVMAAHWMQGNLLDLEISSIMFGLLALWLIMDQASEKRWRFFLAGMASACAFLCKQFGMGFFLLAVVLMLFKFRNGIKQIGLFVLGFVLPVVVCIAVWGKNFLDSTLMNGYGTTIDDSYGRSVGSKMNQVWLAFKLLCTSVAPSLLVTLLFVPMAVRVKQGWIMAFAWLGIAGFLLQYYFSYGAYHYMLYTLPFVMIVIAIVLSSFGSSSLWKKILFASALAYMVGYSIYADYYNKVWKLYLNPQYKQKEIVLSEEVKNRVPPGATIWIPNSGVFFVHYYSNLTPPNLSTIGYSFGDDGLTQESAVEQAHAADFVLSFDCENVELYYTKELKDFIYCHKAVYVDTIWNVVLHDMSELKEDNGL